MKKIIAIVAALSIAIVSMIAMTGVVFAREHQAPPRPEPRILQLPSNTPQHILDLLDRIDFPYELR